MGYRVKSSVGLYQATFSPPLDDSLTEKTCPWLEGTHRWSSFGGDYRQVCVFLSVTRTECNHFIINVISDNNRA